jgi:hypothetical protein
VQTENLRRRRRSSFPPFENRKGWGSLNFGDTSREKAGQPAEVEESVKPASCGILG